MYYQGVCVTWGGISHYKNLSLHLEFFLQHSINACVDLIVNGTELLRALDILPGSRVNHDTVKTLAQLQEVFHHHFANGAGAERHFSNKAVFKQVVSAASKLEGGQVL